MSKYLVVETRVRNNEPWRAGGHMTEEDCTGSFSSNGPNGREVYVFGWMEGHAGVWRSRGGVDIESATRRQILSDGLDLLSHLASPFVLKMFASRGETVYVRFSLADSYPEGSLPPPKTFKQ